MKDEAKAALNTDRELWREREGDYYADSLHVTEGGGIGMNCGGSVIVMPIRKWHEAARALLAQPKAAPARVADGVAAIPSADEVTAKAQSSAAPDSGMPEAPDLFDQEGYPATPEQAVFVEKEAYACLLSYALSLREKREGIVTNEEIIEMDENGKVHPAICRHCGKKLPSPFAAAPSAGRKE